MNHFELEHGKLSQNMQNCLTNNIHKKGRGGKNIYLYSCILLVKRFGVPGERISLGGWMAGK